MAKYTAEVIKPFNGYLKGVKYEFKEHNYFDLLKAGFIAQGSKIKIHKPEEVECKITKFEL